MTREHASAYVPILLACAGMGTQNREESRCGAPKTGKPRRKRFSDPQPFRSQFSYSEHGTTCRTAAKKFSAL